jgi:hypothetical protein
MPSFFFVLLFLPRYHLAMADTRLVNAVRVVIDSKSPWKLTLRNFNCPPHPYKMSVSEWQALLARATQGDPEAEWEVAGRYEDGCKDDKGRILVRRSARKAAEWTRRAAEQGLVSAQINLGVLLRNGAGIEKNEREAFYWTKKAFREGNDACTANNIAITYRQNGNLRRAVWWFQKCVALGDDEALVQLGIHYYWGKGVRKNPKAAVRCFRKATKGDCISGVGRDDAFFCLGLAYFEGKGVKQSTPIALRLFQRANVDKDNLSLPAKNVSLS